MPMCNKIALGALTAFALFVPFSASAGDDPPYASATEAYRQGASALKEGMPATAIPALEYAAKRGVLGAQVKLARAYASGRDLPKDDAKAFSYFQQIADQQAEISPRSPVAKYAAEAFVALGQYYFDGVPEMNLSSNPAYAGHLFRHAASYFGNAEAQYRLARLYINGDGVEKNVSLAVNWLATAAKKQHAASQATLGEILWRGEEIRQRRARGLALIILAHENAAASGKEPDWIGALYQEAFGGSDNATRKDAEALLPELGGVKAVSAPTAKAKPKPEIVVMPAGGASEPGSPPATDAVPTPGDALSIGFGAAPSAGPTQ